MLLNHSRRRSGRRVESCHRQKYQRLFNRNTWQTSTGMNVTLSLWNFRAKFRDPGEKRCISKLDLLLEVIRKWKPFTWIPMGCTFPFASLEIVRLLIAFCASNDSIVEDADIGNAYSEGRNPRRSQRTQTKPGKVRKLNK